MTTNGAPTLSGEYSWIIDRYPADVFEQVAGETQGKAGAIHMQLGPCGYYDRGDGGRADPAVQQDAYFWDTQGSKTLPGIVPGSAIVATELFLPEGWDTANSFIEAPGTFNYVGDFQEPSLMLTLADGNGDPVLYPVVSFVNRSNADDPPRVRIYDYSNAQWVTADVDIAFGEWNAIEVRFDKDENGDLILEYRINGETVFTENIQDVLGAAASDPGLGLKEVMLHSENNNSSPYDVYWHNTYAANLLGPGDSISGAVTGHLVLVGGSTLLDEAEIDGDLVLFDGASVGGAGSFTGGGVVKTGSTLGGNVFIAGNLTNLSGIIAPGNSPGIITIGGNYTGSLAGPDDTVPAGIFEVDVSATTPVAGTDYDQFNIGGTAAGVTAITLADLSVAGSAIGDLDDILLIRIGDTSLDPSGAFVQANRVVKNAHDILLVYGTEADPTYPGYFGLEAVVAAETKALAAVPALGAFAAEQLIGTYVDRRGLDWSGEQGVWGRAVATGFDLGADTGAASSGALGGLQAGFDIAAPAEGWRVGLTASWGALSADLADSARSASVSNAAAGFYVTYVDEGGFYADLLLQYRGIWAELSTPQTASLSVDGQSVDVAAEAGYRFYPWEGLTVVPFGQLLYQGQSLSGYDDGTFSATFQPADTTGRIGVLVEAESQWGMVFGSAALVADLDGKQQTTVSSFPLEADTADLQVQVSGGIEAELNAATHLAVSGFYRAGLTEAAQAFGLNASLRVAF